MSAETTAPVPTSDSVTVVPVRPHRTVRLLWVIPAVGVTFFVGIALGAAPSSTPVAATPLPAVTVTTPAVTVTVPGPTVTNTVTATPTPTAGKYKGGTFTGEYADVLEIKSLTLEPDYFGDASATARIKNVGTSEVNATLTLTVLRGEDPAAVIIGFLNVAPNATSTVSLMSTDKYRPRKSDTWALEAN